MIPSGNNTCDVSEYKRTWFWGLLERYSDLMSQKNSLKRRNFGGFNNQRRLFLQNVNNYNIHI